MFKFHIISRLLFISLMDNLLIIPPSPFKFVNKPKKSSLVIELSEVVSKINELMPQLSEFITQFNNIIMNDSVNVITETNGNMSIDVPSNMSDSKAEQLSKKIGIIDRLITTRGQEIDALLQKGFDLENKLKEQDPKFASQILEKANEFKKLNNTYRH